jgi:hypothetical protein
MSKLSKIGCSDFRWRAFILLVTAISIPVVAISFFLYASLATVGHEITDLGRVYGKFLFKEQMTRHLLTMAKGLESLQEEGAQQGAGG